MADPRPPSDAEAAPPTGPDGRPDGPPEQDRARARRPWWRRGLRGLALALGAVVLLVLLALLLLQTEWGRLRVQGLALQQIQNLLDEGAVASADRIDGNFLTGARMIGFEITQGDTTVIRVDTLRIAYDLTTLLSRTFAASELYAGGVGVYAYQAADSTWNLTRILRPAPEDDVPADTAEAAAWTVRIDSARVRRGEARVHFHAGGRDSVLVVDAFAADLSAFSSGPEGLAGALDALAATVTPAARPSPVALAAAGTFTDERARIRALTLRSDETDLRASGVLNYGEDEPFTFDLDVRAEPLSFADVRAFVPVPLYGTPTIGLKAQGTPEDILAQLHAAFEDGGTVDLNGAFSAATDGPVRYAAEGTVTALNLATLLGDPALASDLNATLDVELAGASPERLDGTVDLQVRGSRYGDQRIQRAALTGTFEAGLLRFDLDAAVPGASVVARGTARPFADVPTYDVRGEARQIDLAALLNDPAQSGRFTGTFALEGRGLDPETAVATAAVRLTSGQYGDLRVEAARLDATLSRSAVAYDLLADLAGPGNVLAAEGTLRPFAGPLAYTVERGRIENVDLAALTGSETTTDLSGTFTLSGRGLPPDGALTLDATLRDARYGTYTVPLASVDATLEGGRLDFATSADLGDAGRLSATGTARPFAEPLTYAARGDVENLNLAALLDDPTQESDLTGSFRLAGTGTDPQTLAADLRLELRDSRYRQQLITAGTVTGTLRRGDLDLAVDATTPEGQLAFTVTGRPFDDVPTVALSEGTFSGVNLALLLDAPNLQTSLNGRVSIDGRGFDPAASATSGTLTFFPSTINGADLLGGTVRFALEGGFLDASADLNFATGEAAFTFEGRPFDERPTYAAAGTLDDLDLAALLSPEPTQMAIVDLAFDVEGAGFDPRTATLTATLRGHAALPDATVDTLHADVALADAVLRVDDLLLRSTVADATAEGTIALYGAAATAGTDLTFAATVKDTEPLNAYLPQPVTLENGEVTGRAFGEPGRPLRFDVQAEADQFAYGDTRASRLDVRLTGEYRPAAATAAADSAALADSAAAARPSPLAGFRGTARLQFGFLSVGGLMIERGNIDAAYSEEGLAAEGAVGIDRARDFTFRLRTDLQPEANRVILETFTFNVEGERWELLQEATLSYGERYRIRNLLLHSGPQQIAADGVIDLDGEQNLVVTVERVEIDPFTDLVGYDGVGGEVTATLVLSGPAEAPVIEGALRIDSLRAGGEYVGALDADVAYDSLRLRLDALLTHVSGETLTAEGFLPVDFRLAGEGAGVPDDAEVRFAVRADSFPVAWVDPFLPQDAVDDLGGTLAVDLRVGGTQAAPVLEGEALLTDGRLGLPTLGRTYGDVRVPLTFERNLIRVGAARAGTRGNGELRATGTIALQELSVGELDLAIEMDEFRVIDTPTYDDLRLTASPADRLRFEGTTERPRLTGAVTLSSGDIYLTEELTGPSLEQVELTPAEVQRLEATFGVRIAEADTARSLFFENLALDLRADIERNVWLRSRKNPVLDIEFTGSVLAQKRPGGDVELFRTIEVNRGRVQLYGRNFSIERGTLTFNGPVEETLIDLEAAFEVPAVQGPGNQATILIAFTGRLAENPELTLSSDPPMENADIACYLATSRPCGEAFQGTGAAEGLAVSQLGALVEGLAANSLGLDVVEVQQRPDGTIVVTFGSYVTSRTFASLSQVVVEGQRAPADDVSRLPEVTVERELLDWLLLRLERRNIGGVGGGALVEFSY